MRRVSGLLAYLAGAALIVTTTGTAMAQEESAAPDEAEASPAVEVVEPSTLSILQVATDKRAGTKLTGKKYAKAIAKAAPNAVAYLVAATDGDAADRVIKTVLMARTIDSAGDMAQVDNSEIANAWSRLAAAVYRNGWTSAGTGPVELNAEIDQAVTERYAHLGPDLGIELWRYFSIFAPEGWYDICVTGKADWIVDQSAPWECSRSGGTPLRVEAEFIDDTKNETKELYSGPPEGLDAGFALHWVAEDRDANTKLKGKKYRKAIAAVAPIIAGYAADGSGNGRMNGIIDMVLLAREADEAGNAKAAKAFMALALAAFREGMASSELLPGEFVTTLHELGQTTYEGQPGVALLPPDGFELICLNERKNGPDYFAAPEDLWACTQQGGRVLFVAGDDPNLDIEKNGTTEGFYTGDS